MPQVSLYPIAYQCTTPESTHLGITFEASYVARYGLSLLHISTTCAVFFWKRPLWLSPDTPILEGITFKTDVCILAGFERHLGLAQLNVAV